MKNRLIIAILLLFAILLIVVIIASIVGLRQYRVETNLENEEKMNKLQMNWLETMKQYSELLNSLDKGSSLVKLAKDDIAQIVFNNLENIKADLENNNEMEEKSQNGN